MNELEPILDRRNPLTLPIMITHPVSCLPIAWPTGVCLYVCDVAVIVQR